MPTIPFSPSKRATIVEAAQHTPHKKVAARFGCALSTVYRLIDIRKARGTSTSPPQAGRPQKLDERDLRRLERIILANRQAPLDSLALTLKAFGIPLSKSTLRQTMTAMGYHRHVAQENPFLNERAQGLRRQYAALRMADTYGGWRQTVYVDEAAVRMNGSVRTWVTCKKGKVYLLECLAPNCFL